MKPKGSLLVVALVLSLFLGELVCEAQFAWTTNADNTITVTGYTGPGGVINIPGTINNLTVTSIGSSAFYENSSLTSVSIPDSVTTIQGLAFYFCTGLTNIGLPTNLTSIGTQSFGLCTGLSSITIPEGVVSIGSSAFSECSSLTSVTIPASVTSMGKGVFSYSPSLAVITVDTLNPAYTSQDDVLFDKGQTTLLQYPAQKAAASYTVPLSVTNIADNAFRFCAILTNVLISSNIFKIGSGAFAQSSSLTAMTVDAFNTLYSSVDGVLFDKNQSTLIQYPGGRIGAYTVPDSVQNIGVRTNTGVEAFGYCSGLTSITIPKSVTNITGGAFFSCSNLSSITIPDSITTIQASTFWNCTSLASATLPNTVTSIGASAFQNCTSLTIMRIPSSVISVGTQAFQGCANLTVFFFMGNAPTAGSSAFSTGGLGLRGFYLPGTSGWGTFSALHMVLWNPQIQTGGSTFGVRTNRFGFTITGNNSVLVVVEATTDLANPAWYPVGTNTIAGGRSYFSDAQWTNYPARFYHLRSP